VSCFGIIAEDIIVVGSELEVIQAHACAIHVIGASIGAIFARTEFVSYKCVSICQVSN